MSYNRLYLLIIIIFFSFSTVVIAENNEVINDYDLEEKEYQEKVDSINKRIKEIDEKLDNKIYKEEKTSFFYLLGTGGYSSENDKYGIYTYNGSNSRSVIVTSNSNHHGFLVNVTGGWQVRKYFAMELGLSYSQSISRSIGVKYALLFQPYLEVSKSWSIMPKLGIGLSGDGVIAMADKDYSLSDSTISSIGNFKVALYGVFGLSVNYKKFIFGLSYENTLFSMISEFRILGSVGIKF